MVVEVISNQLPLSVSQLHWSPKEGKEGKEGVGAGAVMPS